MIRPKAPLARFAIDEGIVEMFHVPRGFPDSRVHEDGRVEALDIVALLAAAAPMVTGYLATQDAKAAEATKLAAADRKFNAEQQAASEKRMMTVLTALQGKKESLTDAIKAMGS